jgi:hypothetical protein
LWEGSEFTDTREREWDKFRAAYPANLGASLRGEQAARHQSGENPFGRNKCGDYRYAAIYVSDLPDPKYWPTRQHISISLIALAMPSRAGVLFDIILNMDGRGYQGVQDPFEGAQRKFRLGRVVLCSAKNHRCVFQLTRRINDQQGHKNNEPPFLD